eukprot:365752-Chlamydomonas_euryale.AAC.8
MACGEYPAWTRGCVDAWRVANIQRGRVDVWTHDVWRISSVDAGTCGRMACGEYPAWTRGYVDAWRVANIQRGRVDVWTLAHAQRM